MPIPPISHSRSDRERQRVEHDISLGTMFSVDRRGTYPAGDDSESAFSSVERRSRREATFSSGTSDDDDDDETVEFPRSAHGHGGGMRHHLEDLRYDSQRSPTPVNLGKHPSSSNLGRKHRGEPSSCGEYSGMSPGSTMGHHASRMTLGAGGLFENRPRDRRADKENDEYDPDRPVEKLVREIEHLPRSNIFSKKSPPHKEEKQHHLGSHLAPRHHRPVQPSPLRSLVVPSPDPSVTRSRSKSQSKSRAMDRSEENERSRYQARVEDAPDEGTHRYTTSARTASHPVDPAPTPRVRVVSNPETQTTARNPPRDVSLADMTRLTGMLATPKKGAAHGAVPDDGPNDDSKSPRSAPLPSPILADPFSYPDYINETLKDALARMAALQDETALARRRIRELEADLERARAEGARSQRHAEEVEHRNAVLESEKKGKSTSRARLPRLTLPRTGETRRRLAQRSRQGYPRMARRDGTDPTAPGADRRRHRDDGTRGHDGGDPAADRTARGRGQTAEIGRRACGRNQGSDV